MVSLRREYVLPSRPEKTLGLDPREGSGGGVPRVLIAFWAMGAGTDDMIGRACPERPMVSCESRRTGVRERVGCRFMDRD